MVRSTCQPFHIRHRYDDRLCMQHLETMGETRRKKESCCFSLSFVVEWKKVLQRATDFSTAKSIKPVGYFLSGDLASNLQVAFYLRAKIKGGTDVCNYVYED